MSNSANQQEQARETDATHGSEGSRTTSEAPATARSKTGSGSSNSEASFAMQRWLAETAQEGPWNGMLAAAKSEGKSSNK
ncbi:hypothetical protein E2P81_ATG10316 [Venturia nashicola]|nr:hypothetical protein E2P81_ATG10316 [Venturia nashicola]